MRQSFLIDTDFGKRLLIQLGEPFGFKLHESQTQRNTRA